MAEKETQEYIVSTVGMFNIHLNPVDSPNSNGFVVPRYSLRYTENLEKKINNLSEDETKRFEIGSATEGNWYIKEFDPK